MVLYMSLGAFFKFSIVGLKFDRVLSWVDLNTNVVIITIVPVETSIGVSPVVQPYISVTFPGTFGPLPYTSVVLPYTFHKPTLDFRIPPLHYFSATKQQHHRGYID